MPPKGNGTARELQEMKEKHAREMRKMKELAEALQARLVALEKNKKREVEDSESEEDEDTVEEYEEVTEELDAEDQKFAKLLKAVQSDKPKVKVDVSKYNGSLNEDELLDWIAALDNHFECEDVAEDQKVKIAKTKLGGHAWVWWDYVQSERRKQGKSKITSWDKMVARIKGKFLPKDYEIQMFKKLQFLRQKEMDVKAILRSFIS